MPARRTTLVASAWFAAAWIAAGALGSACNALSGVGDFGVVSEAGPEGAADVGYAEGAAEGEAASVQEAGEAASDASPDSGRAGDGDAGADAVSDGGPGDAPDDREIDAGGDAPGDASPDDAGDAGIVCAATCDGGCPVRHTNGLGQAFYDCAALGTYDMTQAFEACAAFTGDVALCALDPVSCGGANVHQVCSNGFSSCGCWRYSGLNTGQVNNLSACGCGPSGYPNWN